MEKTKIKKLNEEEQEIVRLLYIGNKKAKQVRDIWELKKTFCGEFFADRHKINIINTIMRAAENQKREYYRLKNKIVEHLYNAGKAKCEKYNYFVFENGIARMYLYEIGDYCFHCNAFFGASHLKGKLKDDGELEMVGGMIKIEGEEKMTLEEIIDELSLYIDEEPYEHSLHERVLHHIKTIYNIDDNFIKEVKKVKDVSDILPFFDSMYYYHFA